MADFINLKDLDQDTYKATFDSYMNKKDYNGLTSYLKKIRCDNIKQQIDFNNFIDSIELEGARYYALTSKANQEQRSQLNLLHSIRTGTKITNLEDYTNAFGAFKYGDNSGYLSIINEMTSEISNVGSPALEFSFLANHLGGPGDKLKIRFDSNVHNNYWNNNKNFFADILSEDEEFANTAFSDFTSKLNLSDDAATARTELEDMGIIVTPNEKDGTTEIEINKNNMGNVVSKLFPALRDLKAASGDYRWQIISDDKESKDAYKQDLETYNQQVQTLLGNSSETRSWWDRIFGGGDDVQSYDVWSDGYNKKIFDKMVSMYDAAVDTENKLLGYNEDDKPRHITTNLLSRPIAGPYQDKLIQLTSNGMLEREDYAGWLKEYNQMLDIDLLSDSFGKYTIYGNEYGSTDDTLHEYTDEEKQDVRAIIQSAVDAGKVTKTFGNLDGEYGLIVSIAPYKSTLNDKTYHNDHPRQYFIKDFYKDHAAVAFENDTRSKAITQIGELNKYHGVFNTTMSDDYKEFIEAEHRPDENGMDINTGYYLKHIVDNNGAHTVERITSDEARRDIERRIIAKDAINRLAYTMTDPNGNSIRNPNLMKHLDDIAEVASLSLYPEEVARMKSAKEQGLSLSGFEEFFRIEQNKLKKFILRGLNYNNN